MAGLSTVRQSTFSHHRRGDVCMNDQNDSTALISRVSWSQSTVPTSSPERRKKF